MDSTGKTFQIERVVDVNDKTIRQLNLLLDHKYDIEQGKKFLRDIDNALFLAFSDERVVDIFP